jgi:hypothetical protein
MRQQTTNTQPEKKPTHVNNALGFSLAASMLMAACGGGTDAVPPATALDMPPAATPEVPVVQPAWGSIGVLVAPGQASKVFNFSSCMFVGEGSETFKNFSNVTLQISPEGDVSVKAAISEGGSVQERLNWPLAQTTHRSIKLEGQEGALTRAEYASYKNTQDNYSYSFSANAQRVEVLIRFPTLDIPGAYVVGMICRGSELTMAALTPALAFLPSEQRVVQAMLAGANAVLENPSAFERLINGIFYWSQGSAAQGFSLNLSTGKMFKGQRDSGNPQALLPSPAPTPVNFASLVSGSYREHYRQGADVDRQLDITSTAFTGGLTRRNDTLIGFGLFN